MTANPTFLTNAKTWEIRSEASPPFRAGLPGKEDEHSCIAPLDPALMDGGSALRQHCVSGERAGQALIRNHILPIP
jgi:hypothetical protein